MKKYRIKQKELETNERLKFPDINVLILNAPCNGFGDSIFCYKLYNYMKYIFGTKCTIASVTVNKIKILNSEIPDSELLQITDKYGNIPNNSECRRFRYLKLKTDKIFDLIFVAPIVSDFYYDFSDIKKLIPYATRYNTYSFSEYDDYLDKKFDFNTGIGSGRLGLFFTDVPSDQTLNFKNLNIKTDPYAISYISIDGVIPNWVSCLSKFIEMCTKKYKFQKFQIIIPDMEPIPQKMFDAISSYYKNIIVYDKGDKIKYVEGPAKGPEFIFRRDIFPVQNKAMFTLMKFSVKDILLTGDQSITDCLSCCPEKNIWYQIAPWKEIFGKKLAELLPNPFFKHKKTSCGCLKCISFKSDYLEFISRNDFRINCVPKMNGILLFARSMKNVKNYKLFSKRSKKRSKKRLR